MAIKRNLYLNYGIIIKINAINIVGIPNWGVIS